MKFDIDYERGITNRGNQYRLKELMKRARKGEKIVVGFLGGSITQGCASTTPQKCYAYHVYEWWKEKFPKSEIEYVNAGIGGTSSQFGVARADDDLLSYNPDFVITEFSVNDTSTDHFMETYEGLIRKVFTYKTNPAVVIVHNVYYDSGSNAQRVHARVGRHYDIPCVSMQSTIYPEILSGKIENRTITGDDLHPNDEGHALVASVITYFLDRVYENMDEAEDKPEFPEPFTDNSYEKSVRYRNMDIEPVSNGFTVDNEEQTDITDCFKKGWYAKDNGSTIEFSVEGTGISLQYRRYAFKSAPKARVVIDNEDENAVVLDGKFDQDWGDNLELTTIAEKMDNKTHNIKITIEDTDDCEAPFYLVSVIVTK